jgi:glycosyltransferase involved in cell wall biosynthesis
MERSSQAGRPRIAVVVPCYNDGATLPEAIESIRAQEPCELVVVDDGSTDSTTKSVFEELEGTGVHVVHQENAGLSAARMAGVDATSAPYVVVLDADDRIEPASLTALADALDAHPSARAAWGDDLTFGRVEMLVPQGGDLDPWLITYLNEWPATAMFRREAILESGGWELRGGYEDWDLWMTFAERGWTGIHVPRVVANYRLHAGRMLGDSVKRHGEIYANLRRRHSRLFAERAANRSRSPAPRRAKMLFPVIDALPLTPRNRLRMWSFILHPMRVSRQRFASRAHRHP